VRPNGVAVPMGSLLSVIAVTVTANAPATVEGAAVKVKTARPPMMPVLADTDLKRPAPKSSGPARPPGSAATPRARAHKSCRRPSARRPRLPAERKWAQASRLWVCEVAVDDLCKRLPAHREVKHDIDLPRPGRRSQRKLIEP
jgi:hypothetical protein